MQRLLIAAVLTVSSGCLDPSAFQSKKADQAAAAAPPQAAAPAPQPAAAPAAAAPRGADAIPDMEAQIVDKQQALAQNPALVETSNKMNTTDPILAISGAYFSAASRVEIIAFQHNIDIWKAANDDRYPSYQEFMDMYRTANVKFKGVKPYQVYAYDQSDGTICILEDRAEKKRRYEAAGIEYTE
jgi:hypothetical protein